MNQGKALLYVLSVLLLLVIIISSVIFPSWPKSFGIWMKSGFDEVFSSESEMNADIQYSQIDCTK